jgi:hypothetical protein
MGTVLKMGTTLEWNGSQKENGFRNEWILNVTVLQTTQNLEDLQI